MKTPRPLLLAVLFACFAATAVAQSPEQSERVAASFLIARGRAPTAAEASAWAAQAGSVSDLVARHRQQLQSDAAAKRAVAVKAAQDAFGRAPTAAELTASSAEGATYTELVKRHLQWLATHPEEYAQVLSRAYKLVISRDVYTEEIDYWKKEDMLSYAMVVGCVEDWGRRNQPGLMVTVGTPTVSVNSFYLATARLSPAIAAEARTAAGLASPSEAERTANPGRNVVAPGAEKLASNGRIHFAAAGGDNLTVAREGN